MIKNNLFKKFEKNTCNLDLPVVLYQSRRKTMTNKQRNEVGIDCIEGPPVPIPNTEVKLDCAEDTWLVTTRDNRFSPTLAVIER